MVLRSYYVFVIVSECGQIKFKFFTHWPQMNQSGGSGALLCLLYVRKFNNTVDIIYLELSN